MATERAHSTIGASSMHRWARCPGSVRLSEGIQSVSSSYAEEGTKAHAHAAAALEYDRPLPNDLDDETRDAINLYVNTVRQDQRESDHDNDDMLVEHRFDLASVHPGCFGTADCVVYHAEAQLLRVYDYKHGAGVPVEVAGNPQLRFYALGALLSTNLPAREVESVIVQPRCYHPDGPVRRERIDAMDLVEFAADLKQYAVATEDPSAPLVPGVWCRWCPAAAICPAQRLQAVEAAKMEFAPGLSYDPDKLSTTLGLLPQIEAWVKSVREFAYTEAEAGRCPPGWKLVDKRPVRKWMDTDDAAAVLIYQLRMDAEELYTTELRSPAQIEKLIPKTKRGVLDALTIKTSSGHTLAPISDPRPEARSDAASDFGGASPAG